MDCQKTFFGLSITKEIENKLIEVTSFDNIEELGNISIQYDSLEEIEKISVILFSLYQGQNEILIYNFDKWKKVILLHTNYLFEEFFLGIYNTIYPKLEDITMCQIYQNYDKPLIPDIDQDLLNKAKDEAKEDLKALKIQLLNLLHPPAFKQKDSEYSFEQKKLALEGTLRTLKSFELFDETNEELGKVIANLSNLTDKSMNKLLNKIEESDLNFLSSSNDIFYIDIVNIVYSVCYINKYYEEERVKIDTFKHKLEILKDGINFFNISNLINNLTLFAESVNKNQVLEYVTLYYYEFIINDKSDKTFHALKVLVSLLFDKQSNKLFLNSKIDVLSIQEPFSFLYYPVMEYASEEIVPWYQKAWQLCRNKDIAIKFRDASTNS